MYILHFSGEGQAFMSGVSEYLYLTEDPPTEEEKEPAPGFELTQVYDTDTDNDYCSLPLNRVLISHF